MAVLVELIRQKGESTPDYLAYLTFYEEGRGGSSLGYDNQAGSFDRLIKNMEEAPAGPFEVRGFLIPESERPAVLEKVRLLAADLPLAPDYKQKVL